MNEKNYIKTYFSEIKTININIKYKERIIIYLQEKDFIEDIEKLKENTTSKINKSMYSTLLENIKLKTVLAYDINQNHLKKLLVRASSYSLSNFDKHTNYLISHKTFFHLIELQKQKLRKMNEKEINQFKEDTIEFLKKIDNNNYSSSYYMKNNLLYCLGRVASIALLENEFDKDLFCAVKDIYYEEDYKDLILQYHTPEKFKKFINKFLPEIEKNDTIHKYLINNLSTEQSQILKKKLKEKNKVIESQELVTLRFDLNLNLFSLSISNFYPHHFLSFVNERFEEKKESFSIKKTTIVDDDIYFILNSGSDHKLLKKNLEEALPQILNLFTKKLSTNSSFDDLNEQVDTLLNILIEKIKIEQNINKNNIVNQKNNNILKI